jgi:hypothetical protein
MSLRAKFEKAIQNSPYETPIGGFFYGFSSSMLGFLIIIVIAYIIYDVNKKNSYSQTLENIQAILQEHRHVLPLYYSKEWRELIKTKKMDTPTMEIKPSISTDVPFIVPSIDTAEVPTPAPSSLKRRKNVSEVFEINKEDI